MKTIQRKCTGSAAAVEFWRQHVAGNQAFNPAAENFWAITLDSERQFIGAHLVPSRSFGDAQTFADELLASGFLRVVPEFLLIHHRPGVELEASPADKARIRAVILAGRARQCELLDCLIVGAPSEQHLLGFLSFYRLPGFKAAYPFAKQAHKPHGSGSKVEAAP